VEDKDASQEALEQVEKATDSDRANGEDLLGSEELKRQLREAKKRVSPRIHLKGPIRAEDGMYRPLSGALVRFSVFAVAQSLALKSL
jgi:hypothetical protein